MTTTDVTRGVELIEQYAEQYANIDLSFVDASLGAIAERLRNTCILTLDQENTGE